MPSVHCSRASECKITKSLYFIGLIFYLWIHWALEPTRLFDWTSQFNSIRVSIVKYVPGIGLLHVWWLHKNSVRAHITSQRARLTALQLVVPTRVCKFLWRNSVVIKPRHSTPLWVGCCARSLCSVWKDQFSVLSTFSVFCNADFSSFTIEQYRTQTRYSR